MAIDCNIKENSEAYNHGLESFYEKYNGNNPTSSIRKAIKDIKLKYPEVNFNPNSFAGPLVEVLKKNEAIDPDYQFSELTKKTKTLEQKISDRESSLNNSIKKIKEKIDNKDLSSEPKTEKITSDDIEKKESELKSLREKLENAKKEAKTGKYSEEQKIKNATSKKIIDKISTKAAGLSESQKAIFAKETLNKLNEKGILTNEDVTDAYAEALGLPSMNTKSKELINEVSTEKRELNKIQDEINKKAEELNSLLENKTLDDKKNKDLAVEIFELGKKEADQKLKLGRAQSQLSQQIQEKRFSGLNLVDFQVMNLLSPSTLEANITGMLADMALRFPARVITAVVNTAIDSYKNKKFDTRNILSRTQGTLKNVPQAVKNAKEATLYNNQNFGSEIPKYDHLNAVTAFKKMVDSHGTASKTKNAISFLLRVHPDTIKRMLAGPDQFFHTAILGGELNRIADQKGLKGAERELFLVRPDEKSLQSAYNLADEATLRKENKLSKLVSYNPMQDYENKIEDGMDRRVAKSIVFLKYFALKNIAPFTKTPLNLINLAARYSVPGYEIARVANLAHKEKDGETRRQIITDGIGTVAVGFAVQKIAFSLLIAGGISAGFGEDDEKTAEGVEKQLGGNNRVNFHALMRLLSGGSAEWQKGDKGIELRGLGVLGMVLGVHANAFNQYSKDEIKDKSDILSVISNLPDEARSALVSSLDNSFMAGTNTTLDVIRSKRPEDRKKYAIQAITNLFNGIAPSTYQKISMASEENIKKTYNKEDDFLNNLYSTLGYKFLFSEVGNEKLNKYYNLSEEDGGQIKKKDYYLFDNNLGRAIHSEFSVFKGKEIENSTLTKIYNEAKTVEGKERGGLYPSSIGKNQTLEIEGENIKVNLSTEQYDYLTEKASFLRTFEASVYINGDDWKKDDFDTKSKTLQKFYKSGLENAKTMLVNKYFGDFEVITNDNSNDKASENFEKYQPQE